MSPLLFKDFSKTVWSPFFSITRFGPSGSSSGTGFLTDETISIVWKTFSLFILFCQVPVQFPKVSHFPGLATPTNKVRHFHEARVPKVSISLLRARTLVQQGNLSHLAKERESPQNASAGREPVRNQSKRKLEQHQLGRGVIGECLATKNAQLRGLWV